MARIIRWRPHLPFHNLHDQMERFMDMPFHRHMGHESTANFGSADVKVTDKEIMVTLDLPGMDKKDIETKVSGNTLVISGNRNGHSEEKGENYYLCEREVGEFQRAITLPAEVDSKKAKAQYADGVLTITLPKAERLLPAQINIQ